MFGHLACLKDLDLQGAITHRWLGKMPTRTDWGSDPGSFATNPDSRAPSFLELCDMSPQLPMPYKPVSRPSTEARISDPETGRLIITVTLRQCYALARPWHFLASQLIGLLLWMQILSTSENFLTDPKKPLHNWPKLYFLE